MAIIRNDSGNSLYPVRGVIVVNETYKTGASTFNLAASPLVIDVATTLTPSGHTKKIVGSNGYLAVDGAGDLLLEWSNAGTQYLTQITIKSGEKFSFQGKDVDHIRLTHSGTDTNFRLLVE